MLHEILHSLGAEHPNDNDEYQVPDSVNNWEHTILAAGELEYSHSAEFSNGGKNYGVSSSPMPLDIAALQHLYGANKKTNEGDTIYKYSNMVPFYETIWDAGGNDTLELVISIKILRSTSLMVSFQRFLLMLKMIVGQINSTAILGSPLDALLKMPQVEQVMTLSLAIKPITI